jgi:hypothetical protein
MATFHGKSGRFTSQQSAHTVTKAGERFKMVRQLRRIGGKAPAPEPTSDVVDTVEEAKVKEAMASFLGASPGWTQFHDIMGVAFGEPAVEGKSKRKKKKSKKRNPNANADVEGEEEDGDYDEDGEDNWREGDGDRDGNGY